MASTTRTLTVNLVGRSKNLEKAFKRVSKGSSLMSDKLMRATRVAGVGFGALAGVAIGAAAALKPMIDKAADVEESLSKNNVVFGDSAKAVEQFAQRSLQAFGVTRREALEATGIIGTLGSAMGMAEADSASMATTLVGLAGDMSSFNNASVEETLTAIQAGLRGEAEPLRRFGVLLDAATLKAKALEKGIITSTKDALTPQAKALAAYAVILEQTEVQMGDFERTSDSATNQQKLLAGAVDDLQVAFGEMLLPTFTAGAAWVNENLVPWAQDLVDRVESEGIFNTVGFQFGELIQSGMGQSLMFWKDDTAWWERNWFSWLKQKGRDGVIGLAESLKSDPAQEALKAAFEGAGAGGAFDRPLDQRGGGGTPATDVFNAVANLENAAAAIEAAAAAAAAMTAGEPFPGLSQSEVDAITASAVAAAIATAVATTTAATTAAVTAGPGVTQLEGTNGGSVVDGWAAGAGPLVPGPAEGPTDGEIAAWLGTLGGFTGDPGQRGGGTTVIINSTAVSGPELIDEMGKYVQENGPLSRQWIGQ